MLSSLRRGLLFLVTVLALAPSLPGQVPARWASCKMDSLTTWNCAQYYTGTVTLTSDLKGPDLHQTFRVVATVTGGRVSCQVKGTEVGDFEGPGMLALEPANTENSGEYSFSVWCPESADKRARRRDTPLIMIRDQRATNYAMLEGKDSYDHPDSDEVNGLSGTETITWALRRP
jgi:hypothetical protein